MDGGLVQVMEQVAAQMAENGDKNTAQWLSNLARQLAAMLGNPPTSAAPQEYFNFLMETLQKVSDNPNPQLIYPFWAQNLDKLNENLARILDSWARETLTQVTPEQVYSIAAIIENFSNLIEQFPLGNIAAKQEIVITGYEIALTIFTFDAFPVECRRTARLLGNLYAQENRWLEATQPYQTALEAVEVLYEESLTLAGKQEELAATGDLFRRTAYALTRVGHLESAAVTLEPLKGRFLIN